MANHIRQPFGPNVLSLTEHAVVSLLEVKSATLPGIEGRYGMGCDQSMLQLAGSWRLSLPGVPTLPKVAQRSAGNIFAKEAESM